MPKQKWLVEVKARVEVEANTWMAAEAEGLRIVLLDPEELLFADHYKIPSCRFCGCTEKHACEGGCSWSLQDPTVCDAPECLAKLEAEQAAGPLSA